MKTSEENNRSRGDIYTTIKSKVLENILDLVVYGHCVVIGYRTWEEINEIRNKDPENYDHVGALGFYFNDQGKENSIYVLMLKKHIWDIYWREYLRKTNYYLK